MTITVDITPEVQAELERQAAEKGRAVELYVASLLEEAVGLPAGVNEPGHTRPPGRKSLVELFAESPLYGLDLDFSRNKSTSRPIDL
jgi:hypothetical protein